VSPSNPKAVEAFGLLFSVKAKTFSEEMVYIVMVEKVEGEPVKVYELEKFTAGSVLNGGTIADANLNTMLSVATVLLESHLKRLRYH
jgi:hypothetical protein